MKLKRKYGLGVDVVTAARQRIKNIFANGLPVAMAFSGGKDSLCMDHLTYELCASGQIDKGLLTVYFIDEEAIYPCIEKVVKACRTKWMSIGVKFEWYAMEYKHYNCLNELTLDETFICFDRTKRDRWIREPPEFAIRDHPMLIHGKDTYQEFNAKRLKDAVNMVAIRASESLQRMQYLYQTNEKKHKILYPIYDWSDKDVWKFLYEKGIEIPEAYIHMWQCGVSKNNLRISQFFSVDTVRQLVRMCEYYPELFDKICKREPNAYMALLYYDTELFRHSKKEKTAKESDEVSYKQKVMEMIRSPQKYDLDFVHNTERKSLRKLVIDRGGFFTEKNWKTAYEILVAGDPKGRTRRALTHSVFNNMASLGGGRG